LRPDYEGDMLRPGEDRHFEDSYIYCYICILLHAINTATYAEDCYIYCYICIRTAEQGSLESQRRRKYEAG
jgi:hypothetical protein